MGGYAISAALASPAPVSVAEVQAELGADEALVLFFDTDDARSSRCPRRPSSGS